MKQRGRNSPRRTEPPSSTSPHYANGKMHKHDLNVVYLTRIKIITLIFVISLALHQFIQNAAYSETPTSGNESIMNPYALSPGELPGYTGWSRPEQTLAGYFHITWSSHPAEPSTRYHSIVPSGEKFTLLLTCIHDENTTYVCPTSGTMFYVRAYGPSVITGNVVDHSNSSYSVEFYPIDAGEYTVEVVVTFSAPLELRDFPLDLNGTDEEEPGYEGYLVSGFPIFILVNGVGGILEEDNKIKQWCDISQLTEQSPLASLTVGHWQVIDHVGRSTHQPLTQDDTLVSLDGYRMGLNSLGIRMVYEYEECELMHIGDIVGNPNQGTGHVMDRCLRELGYLNKQSIKAVGREADASNLSNAIHNFHGVNVIFIGDSVMKLEMGFFIKLLGGPGNVDGSSTLNVTFIETNGGLQSTLPNIISTLKSIQATDTANQPTSKLPNKRVILFNSGLHDIDILCSSKRRRTRNETARLGRPVPCADAYRDTMKQLIQFIDAYPADVKVFRTTTAGWAKYGNYGFTWPASEVQPQSRSTHLVNSFNQIAHEIIQKYSRSILITDGYWMTLPRPDHTQTSELNQVGKHLVHPGYEVLSAFARKWVMLIIWGLCDDIMNS